MGLGPRDQNPDPKKPNSGALAPPPVGAPWRACKRRALAPPAQQWRRQPYIGITGPESHPCSLVPQKMLADNQSKSRFSFRLDTRIPEKEALAVVEECPLGLSDADLNGHRGDCTLNDGRSERPSSTRGLGAGTLYAGAVPGYRRISANGPLLASSDELIM
ncbi:hypothetical protein PGTUg99_018533 [Puccinia graminis f. sp. tritici]|uniref:Uncharacterized protein n=1 Tax=Puccinia graminis f. sp. tritici TaxID=56615 RepID=A0A5B0RZJ2_PUCGR|nr:hypothetical protein PGTUg99_018533 [Puccinia graminis f. sp. tritici]